MLGFKVKGVRMLGFKVKGVRVLGFRVKGVRVLGLRVFGSQGLGLRVLEFRFQGFWDLGNPSNDEPSTDGTPRALRL